MFGLGLSELLIIFVLFGIGFVGTIFWIWMLIDCAINEATEGSTKIVWVIIIALTHLIGALIYCFVRRPQRRLKLGR